MPSSVSSIMLKLPTSSLPLLRDVFLKEKEGLHLVDFVISFVKLMRLQSTGELLRAVPDLIDFFDLVDINGDGGIDWSEFVMFVIDQVAKDKYSNIYEKLTLVSSHSIQPSANRYSIRCCKAIPELKRILIGCPSEIQIHGADDRQSSWMIPPLCIPLKPKNGIDKKRPDAAAANVPPLGVVESKKIELGAYANEMIEERVEVYDLAYLPSCDILFVLRSDMSIEFFRLQSRSKLTSESIDHVGMFSLDQAYTKMAIRDIPKEPQKLFLTGCTGDIDTWTITVGINGLTLSLQRTATLSKHRDICRDLLVIHNEQYSLLVSCGMDSMVYLWDLATLRHKGCRRGLTSGVECLAYDGKNIIIGGGFGTKIFAWDLDAEIDQTVYELWGHEGALVKVIANAFTNRLYSLDADGELRIWDISKSNPNDKELRQIDSFTIADDHLRSFETSEHLSSGSFNTCGGAFIIAHGRRQHTLRIADVSPKESPMVTVLFSGVLKLIVIVHTKEIVFWDGVSGEEVKRVEYAALNSNLIITSAIIDDRQRKIIVGDSRGLVTMYNMCNGIQLKTFPSTNSPIKFLIYSPDRMIIVVTASGDMYVFDEVHTISLRDTKTHEADVVAATFSHKLGLIATVDMTGTLMVWNYEFLSVDIIIRDCALGFEVGQLAFLEPFPLLFIADSSGTFKIIPVGSAYTELGRRYFIIDPLINKNIDDLSVAASRAASRNGGSRGRRRIKKSTSLNLGNDDADTDDSLGGINISEEPPLLIPPAATTAPAAEESEVAAQQSSAEMGGAPAPAAPDDAARASAPPPNSHPPLLADSETTADGGNNDHENAAAAAQSATAAAAAVVGVAPGDRPQPARRSSSKGEEEAGGGAGKRRKSVTLQLEAMTIVEIDPSQPVHPLSRENSGGRLPSSSSNIPSSPGAAGAADGGLGQQLLVADGVVSLQDTDAAAAAAGLCLLDSSGMDTTMDSSADKSYDEEDSSPNSPLRRSSSAGDAGQYSDDGASESSEDEEEDALRSRMKPFSRKRMQYWLNDHRLAKSIAVHVEGMSEQNDAELEEKTMQHIRELRRMSGVDDVDVRARRKSSAVIMYGNKAADRTDIMQELEENKLEQLLVLGDDEKPPIDTAELIEQYKVTVICGHDDGTTSVFDLMPALRLIGVRPLERLQYAYMLEGYNPNRTFLNRIIRDFEYERTTWTVDQINKGTDQTICWVNKIWGNIVTPISCINIVGDNHDIMTASDETAVELWGRNGVYKAVLTRGKEWDKVYRPRWNSPIDTSASDKVRLKKARVFIRELQLDKYLTSKDSSGGIIAARSAATGTAANSSAIAPFQLFQSSKAAAVATARRTSDEVMMKTFRTRAEYESTARGTDGTGAPMTHLTFVEPDQRQDTEDTGMGSISSMPDRERTIKQLSGKQTYSLSAKDVANSQKERIAQKMIEDIRKIGTTAVSSNSGTGRGRGAAKKSMGRRGRGKKKKLSSSSSILLSNGDDDSSSPFISVQEIQDVMKERQEHTRMRQSDIPFAEMTLKKRTAFTVELAKIDTADPYNWEITSKNRQKKLYRNLYYELENHSAVERDQMKLLEKVVEKLTPGGDIYSFVELMRLDRSEATSRLKVLGIDHVRNRNPSDVSVDTPKTPRLTDEETKVDFFEKVVLTGSSSSLIHRNDTIAELPNGEEKEGGQDDGGEGGVPVVVAGGKKKKVVISQPPQILVGGEKTVTAATTSLDEEDATAAKLLEKGMISLPVIKGSEPKPKIKAKPMHSRNLSSSVKSLRNSSKGSKLAAEDPKDSAAKVDEDKNHNNKQQPAKYKTFSESIFAGDKNHTRSLSALSLPTFNSKSFALTLTPIDYSTQAQQQQQQQQQSEKTRRSHPLPFIPSSDTRSFHSGILLLDSLSTTGAGAGAGAGTTLGTGSPRSVTTYSFASVTSPREAEAWLKSHSDAAAAAEEVASRRLRVESSPGPSIAGSSVIEESSFRAASASASPPRSITSEITTDIEGRRGRHSRKGDRSSAELRDHGSHGEEEAEEEGEEIHHHHHFAYNKGGAVPKQGGDDGEDDHHLLHYHNNRREQLRERMQSSMRRKRLAAGGDVGASKKELEAMKRREKESIAESLKRFEDSLENTEKLAKKAGRERRKLRRQESKQKHVVTAFDLQENGWEFPPKKGEIPPPPSVSLRDSSSFSLQPPATAQPPVVKPPAVSFAGDLSDRSVLSIVDPTDMTIAEADAAVSPILNKQSKSGTPAAVPPPLLARSKSALLTLLSKDLLDEDNGNNDDAHMEIERKKRKVESHVNSKIGYAYGEAFHSSSTTDETALENARKMVSLEHRLERYKYGTKAPTCVENVNLPRTVSRGSTRRPTAAPPPPTTARGLTQSDSSSSLTPGTMNKKQNKTSFGPYGADELLGLLRAFNSLPHATVTVANDANTRQAMQRKSVLTTGRADLMPSQHNMQQSLGEQSPSIKKSPSSLSLRGMGERTDSNMSGKQKAALPGLNLDFLRENVAVQVEAVLGHHYIKMRPKFKESLLKALELRVSTGMHARHVHMNMVELLISICPFMTPSERKDCIRFFLAKSEEMAEEEEAKKAANVPDLTTEDVETLQKLFKYFDKSNTGKVMVKHIIASLAGVGKKPTTISHERRRASLNGGEEDSSVLSEGIAAGGAGGEEGVKVDDHHHKNEFRYDSIVAQVGVDQHKELEFAEFVHLFKDILL